MEIVADLHPHSKYSRAVSRQMEISMMARWASKKGINILGTGDFTHPLWFREIEENLEEIGEGIYRFKGNILGARFILTSELSCIYRHLGKVRRIHLIVCFPKLEDVRKFSKELIATGINLLSDGRPIMGLPVANVAKIALGVNSQALIIPAHAWTPWFGIYGANGGYDSLEEAFGEVISQIPAVETGLSSDPAMNWRIKELDSKQIVSFGDAHSLEKLGREETVFEVNELTYKAIREAIFSNGSGKIAYTVEFYSEEGKYHFSGHSKCQVSQSPEETRRKGKTCPVCGRPLIIGVTYRVEELADRQIQPVENTDKLGIKWYQHPTLKKPKFVKLVPLVEILGEVYSLGTGSKKVQQTYEKLTDAFGDELTVLLRVPIEEISKVGGEKTGEAVSRVRSGQIVIQPGYDGTFGVVRVWSNEGKESGNQRDQQVLF